MNLNEKFNNQTFNDWVEQFLPGFSRDVRKVDIPRSFPGVKSIHTLGESSLGVRVYTIEMEIDPSKRKIGLATDSFSLLRNYGTPNAIVVYYSEDSTQWRLSLLTSTPIWNEGKIITKLSNPKRQSYVLGPKAKVKTPHQYLISKGTVADFADLKSRFSLEVVNKDFYKEISHAFIKLVGGTLTNGRSKQTFKPILRLPFVAENSQTSMEFAVRLIGRIIFCWFLREKRSASGNALMPRELLSSEASNNTEDYYHRLLEPIFFEILNRPIKSRKPVYENELFSAIPYLNGGLFSPHEDDFYDYNEGKQAVNHNMVIVPDEWLRSLFEVLETYNFTIDENTSFDEELSIDPEMLGRIFENLLAEINPETGESARKSTGSYYTPRAIVDYMVDESLKIYLKSKINISEEKLKALISYDLEDDEVNPLSNDEKNKIADALGDIKILDPACGSGAFPIGALQKIVFILQQIDENGQLWFKKQIQNTPVELRRVIEREFQEKNFDYIRKLGIIRENIFGIDIQPIATEISRLRCFLTLVVDQVVNDQEENRGINALPNLDFKFVNANSLIGLPKTDQPQQSMFDDHQKIDELKQIRNDYFEADLFEREQLKTKFANKKLEIFKSLEKEHGWLGVAKAELTQKLTDWDPFSHKATSWFDPEWMFGIKDGFDIVIANPPYVRADNPDFKEQRDQIKKSEFYETLYERWDLFIPFIERGLKLLNGSGCLCFITSNSLLTSKFAIKLLEYVQKNYSMQFLDYFSDNTKVFEAGVIPVVFGITKQPISKVVRKTAHEGVFGKIAQKEDVLLEDFKRLGKNAFKPKFVEESLAIDTILLGDICYISYGLRPNSDERFWKGEFTRKDLVSEAKDEVHSKPYLEGKNLSNYRIDKLLYLEWGTERVPKKLVRPTFKELYEVPKLLRGTMVGGTYDETGVVCNHSIVVFAKFIDLHDVNNKSIKNSISKFNEKNRNELEDISKKFDLKYILAILNSEFARKYLNNIRRHRLENYFYPDDYRKLPIPNISHGQQYRFVEIIDQILKLTTSNNYNSNLEMHEDVRQCQLRLNGMVESLFQNRN